MAPPHTFPLVLSASAGDTTHSGLNGFGCATPHSECPGWVSVYSRAVESGVASVLKAFAVYALAFEIAWLPGHALAGSSVAPAVAQISPWRLTTVPHSILPDINPPASLSEGVERSHFLRSSAEGRLLQSAFAAPGVEPRLWSAELPGCVVPGGWDSAFEQAVAAAASMAARNGAAARLSLFISVPPN